MAYPRIPNETKALIIDYFKAGQRPLDIAQTLEVKVAQVYAVLRTQGLYTGHAGRPGVMDKFSPEQIEQIAWDYENSEKAVHQILSENGLSYQQLYSVLGALCLPTRGYSVDVIKSKKARIDRAIQMYMDGLTLDQIYLDTGVGNSVLYRELRRRNMHTKLEDKNEG